MAQPAVQDEEPLPAHKKAMLEACESGDISALQQLFQVHHVKQGDPPIYRESNDDGPPSTWRMIGSAVAHKRPSMVAYLLSTYPTFDVECGFIVQAILDHPDIETFRVLYLHSPGIIDFEFDYMRTILTEACRGGALSRDFPASSETLPLIHYLLDHGADPNVGSFVSGGALYVALQYSRPLDIIEKIVDRGAYIGGLVISEAMSRQRLDALALFFKRRIRLEPWTDQDLLERARETENQEIIALVKDYIISKQKEGRKKKGMKKGKSAIGEKDVSQEKRKWWQFWKKGQFVIGEKGLCQQKKRWWQFWKSESERNVDDDSKGSKYRGWEDSD